MHAHQAASNPLLSEFSNMFSTLWPLCTVNLTFNRENGFSNFQSCSNFESVARMLRFFRMYGWIEITAINTNGHSNGIATAHLNIIMFHIWKRKKRKGNLTQVFLCKICMSLQFNDPPVDFEPIQMLMCLKINYPFLLKIRPDGWSAGRCAFTFTWYWMTFVSFFAIDMDCRFDEWIG